MPKRILTTGLWWTWLSMVIILIDRFAKIWAVDHLSLFDPLPLLPIFNLTLAYNTGAAFSFLHDAAGWQNILLGGIAVIISLVIIRWLYKNNRRDRWLNVALCLILAGALGNLWDRLTYGYVIDFFDFHIGQWHFAIFNTADAAICIGAFMLILHWLFVKD